MFDVLADGMTVLFNGAVATLGALVSPLPLLLVLCTASLAWAAVVEIDELNVRSFKPDVQRH